MKRDCTIILDTDMGNDVDDIMALVMLHSLQKMGECRLTGIAVSKDNAWAGAYTRLINARCGYPDTLVGMVQNGVTPEDGKFVRVVCESLGVEPPDKGSETAVRLLRKLLCAEPDGSVTILSIGFFTNLSCLLNAPGDDISPMDGMDLFARKVKNIVSMAGDFSAYSQETASLPADNPEFNVRMDVASARHFIGQCPRPIVFSGFEVGGSVLFPGDVIRRMMQANPKDPVPLACALYLPMPYDRPTWDPTAVLQAVRPQEGYFDISRPGRVEIAENGYTTFREIPGGLHRHLILPQPHRRRVCEAITSLCEIS